jgi:hypothetical protein
VGVAGVFYILTAIGVLLALQSLGSGRLTVLLASEQR